jgi:hypothetical protein
MMCIKLGKLLGLSGVHGEMFSRKHLVTLVLRLRDEGLRDGREVCDVLLLAAFAGAVLAVTLGAGLAAPAVAVWDQCYNKKVESKYSNFGNKNLAITLLLC